MYSRSTNNGSMYTALCLGALAVVVAVVVKPLLVKSSLALSYPGTWWKTQQVASEQFDTEIYKLPDSTLPNILVIDSKKELGVSQKVFSPDHELLGIVSSVKKMGTHTYGWVELISNREERPLVTLSVNNVLTHVEAGGRGQGVFVAELPGVVQPTLHSEVTLTATGEKIGVVVGVKSSQQDPFQRVFIAPKTQLRSLHGLLVE